MNRYTTFITQVENETQKVTQHVTIDTLFWIYQLRATSQGKQLIWLDDNTYLIIYTDEKYVLIIHEKEEEELSSEEWDNKQIEHLKRIKEEIKRMKGIK